MGFTLSLVMSVFLAFTFITSIFYCVNMSLWNFISKYSFRLFKKKDENEVVYEVKEIRLNDLMNNELLSREKTPKAAAASLDKRRFSLQPTSTSYLNSNFETTSNYSASSCSLDSSPNDSESEISSSENERQVQKKQDESKRLRRVKSELKVPRIQVETTETDASSVDKQQSKPASLFSFFFSGNKQQSAPPEEEDVTQQPAFNGNVHQPDNLINFHIPSRFDKKKSNVTKVSMQAYSINATQINKDEYGSDMDNRGIMSSKAVNLYDKRRRSVLTIQDETLDANHLDNSASSSNSTKLKFSVFNDKPQSLIKFHLISIIDVQHVCKIFQSDVKGKSDTENETNNANAVLVDSPARHQNQFLDVNYSFKNMYKKPEKVRKGSKLSEFYLKLSFDVYHSTNTNQTDVSAAPPDKRRFSDTLLNKLNIKSSKKVLETHCSYKTKVIKYSNESRSISIDQVFTYSNLVKTEEKQSQSKQPVEVDLDLSTVDEQDEEEDVGQGTSYLDLFKSFRNKFFTVKITIHDAATKKKFGKIEVFLDFMNLNLNPFNIFMEEFVAIKEGKSDEAESESNTKSFTLSPEICNNIKKSCDFDLHVSMEHVSQKEKINFRLLNMKCSNQLALIQIRKCYFYYKISMYVLRKRYKKKYSKFHRISPKNKCQSSDVEDPAQIQPNRASVDNRVAFSYELNDLFSFDCTMNKFDQIYFNIELHITPTKKFQSQEFGKISIGSISYCSSIKGFTQMEQMLRNSGNEVKEWHRFS